MEDLVVLEAYRNEGIGSLLLDGIEKEALKRGILRLQLVADVNNYNAHAFYQKKNWKTTRMIVLKKFPAVTHS